MTSLSQDQIIWATVIALSLGSHLGFLGFINSSSRQDRSEAKRNPPIAVKVAVVENPPEPAPPPLPPKPMPKPKPKPKQQKVPSLKKKEATPNESKPIQGLNKEALAAPGKGAFQAPVGNTLMTGDEGIRVSEAGELAEDLSEDAKLIADSLTKPDYTEDAIDVGLEGLFTIDVFVDESGNVTEVEIRKNIGYGMDARIISSVKTAKFIPRKDSMGKSIKGWAVINFRLTIP